MTQSIRRL